MLNTNRAGSFLTTTIVYCNTRKYHGLLICPIHNFDDESFVLLSSLDESIIQNDQSFNLAIHQYPENIYDPKGHKYIIDFEYEPVPTVTYRIGGVILKKELLMKHNSDGILIRYTLEEAHSPTTLRLRPMLAFRNRHNLSKANLFVNKDIDIIDNGIGSRLYNGFPFLYMQINKENIFVNKPDWYYNVVYLEEQKRGYDYQEDLYTPGYFDISINKGEQIIFSASLKEEKTSELLQLFAYKYKIRFPKKNFIDCLVNAASQFIVKQDNKTEIIAGFPWFGRWGRDTFIALPGITLSKNYDIENCKAVLGTMSQEMNNGLFPNIGKDDNAAYNSVDAPMWYFWSIQKYAEEIQDDTQIWSLYGKKMKDILEAFRSGLNNHIMMKNNGLIWAKEEGKALTWMDAIVNGVPVTQRGGYVVEINALWYNAIRFTLHLAELNNDTEFIDKWKNIPKLIEDNFELIFWNEDYNYLADYVDENGQNMDLRPNQVIAISLPYNLLSNEIKTSVLTVIRDELVTPKGLRTLSPNNSNYKGFYQGDQASRDLAYHQGTVWVWLLSHYIESNFNLYGKAYVPEAKNLIKSFEDDIADYGIGTIGEVFDGNPPHKAGGSISQAWSVSEVLRIIQMIEKYSK